jgi:REP element-mobilizing transposase RayT
LDEIRRRVVLESVRAVSARRGWVPIAAHIRSTHVHAVIEADCDPERVMSALKAQASHCLNQLGLDRVGQKRWTRHGSTRWLWNERHIAAAVRYVVEGQGEADGGVSGRLKSWLRGLLGGSPAYFVRSARISLADLVNWKEFIM